MQCYNVYPKHLTYREYLKLVGGKPWLIPVAIAAKFFRLGLGKNVQVFQGGMIPSDPRTFPPSVWEHLGGRMRTFQELGFRSLACEASRMPASRVSTYRHYLVSEDRRIHAVDVICVVNHPVSATSVKQVGLTSYAETGDSLTTADGRDNWPAVPSDHRVFSRKSTLPDLFKLHQARLEGRTDIRELPAGFDGMNALFAKEERERYEYFRKRGIYGPLFTADANRNPISPPPVPAGTAMG